MDKSMIIKNKFRHVLLILLSFLFLTPCNAQNIENIERNFLIFLEKEFLSKKIKTKSLNKLKSFSILDVNQREYIASFKLIKKNINQDIFFVPTLKISRKSDNVSYSLARSLTFERDSNLFQIEINAKMLVNASIIEMKENGLKFFLGDQLYKDKEQKKLSVSINYFNACESSKIIEIMEKKFPGFVHLETDNLTTPSSEKIEYYTTSTIYKIKKWLQIILYDFNLTSKDFFIKSYKSKIDITKVNKLKYIYVCE